MRKAERNQACPDEIFLIGSSDPKVASMDEAVAAFVQLLYRIAE